MQVAALVGQRRRQQIVERRGNVGGDLHRRFIEERVRLRAFAAHPQRACERDARNDAEPFGDNVVFPGFNGFDVGKRGARPLTGIGGDLACRCQQFSAQKQRAAIGAVAGEKRIKQGVGARKVGAGVGDLSLHRKRLGARFEELGKLDPRLTLGRRLVIARDLRCQGLDRIAEPPIVGVKLRKDEPREPFGRRRLAGRGDIGGERFDR